MSFKALSIFVKGEKLKDTVTSDGDARSMKFYKVLDDGEDHLVTLETNGKYQYVGCTCKHDSIYGPHAIRTKHTMVLCSHKIALIKALPLPTNEVFK